MSENSNRLQHLLDHENDPETDLMLLKMLDGADSDDTKLVQEGFKEFARRTGVRKTVSMHPWFRIAIGIAASLFLPLLVLSVWALIHNASKTETEWVFASTSYAETSEISLPDGSLVTLMPGGQLFYPKEFVGKQRKVLLSGEASFDVTKDTRKQFVVNTGKMDIVVHGTRFLVTSFPDNAEDEVALFEGAVEMRPLGQDNSVFMAPGELLVFNKRDGSMQRRRFAVNYINVVVDSKSLAQERYYALFINGEGIDEILSALSASGHFRINKTDNTIHLTK